jgi:hypothetical protein
MIGTTYHEDKEALESVRGKINLAWGSKVSEDFCRKAVAISKRLSWQPSQASDLMSCIAFESGETFSPSVKNMAGSGATGLIQIMPNTAHGLGTTVEDLKLLTAESQLDYVEMYFLPYAKRIKTLSDMYMAILMPKFIGASDLARLFTNGTAYRQNSGLDANNDGTVTKREATAKVAAELAKGLRPGYYRQVDF